MALRFKVGVSPEGRKAIADLKATPDRMRADMVELIETVQEQAVAEARGGAPVFRGILSNSIQADPPLVTPAGHGVTTVLGIVQTITPYAEVQESGRKPGGRFPPISAIRRWVVLKVNRGDLQLTEVGEKKRQETGRGGRYKAYKADRKAAAIDGLAFVIARKIAKAGITGKHFMGRAATKAQKLLETGMDRLAEKWSRGDE